MSKQQQNNEIRNVVEAALMASEVPLSVRKIQNLFDDDAKPEGKEIQKALKQIEGECEGRGIELCKIGKGYRFQTRERYAQWMRRLRDTRPPRYSRAMLETLAIIAYRQPVTRGDIESIRGVAVSTDIMRVLLDREWITQVGHRDVPGRPSLYATSAAFLEYFNLRSMSDLPSLIEPRDINEVAKELNITLPVESADDGGPNKADVMGVDAEGNLIVSEDDDDDTEEDFDDRLDARREQAEAEITESLETIDAELAAIPKITRKSIDSLRADTPAEGEEAKVENPGEGANNAAPADGSQDRGDATGDAEIGPDAELEATSEANADAAPKGVADTVRDADAAGYAPQVAESAPALQASETPSDDPAVPAESERDYEPLASDADVARALAATSFAFGSDSDFDDNLDDVEALNPIVHTVGEVPASDSETSDAIATAEPDTLAPDNAAASGDETDDEADDIGSDTPRQADRDH